MDLSNAHLTPASQAERWIKKIQKLHHFFYVFIIFIITKFGENFEEKMDICFFQKNSAIFVVDGFWPPTNPSQPTRMDKSILLCLKPSLSLPIIFLFSGFFLPLVSSYLQAFTDWEFCQGYYFRSKWYWQPFMNV